jgi:DNA-directed RNA polymerase sigma subunit (sigma70/sigma32)
LTDIWDYTSEDKDITAMNDKETLMAMLDSLTERQREILYDYYGLDDRTPKTFTEIGSKYKVTKEAVHTSAHRGLNNLKNNPDIELFRD